MDQVGVAQLLDDLKSIKLPIKSREFVLSCSGRFKNSDLPISDVISLRKIAKRNRKKIDALYASREAARRSIWRKKNGITMAQANKMVEQRKEQFEAERSDLGI